MAAILLDISRSISRAHLPIPTGIDRVERAYIDHFLRTDRPIWFLARIAGGFAVLNRAALANIYPMLLGETDWGNKDLIARIFGAKKPGKTLQAESTIRRMAQSISSAKSLGRMLRKHIPEGFTYINVGHSNRKKDLWAAIKMSGVGKCVSMIHDVIPLDFPQYCRPRTVLRFEVELKQTAENSDWLIYNSSNTAERTQNWLAQWGVNCRSKLALLGVAPLAAGFEHDAQETPYFVTLGTIEPRKNHRLLLDVWQVFFDTLPEEKIPHLHIVGRRGWLNEDVFETLDSAPMMGKTVFECSNLEDEGLAELLAGARALLFPSYAEGFGYPLVEALQKNIPTICSNLACFQEIAGNAPLYLNPNDNGGWKKAILAYSDEIQLLTSVPIAFPSWEDHFHKIDTII